MEFSSFPWITVRSVLPEFSDKFQNMSVRITNETYIKPNHKINKRINKLYPPTIAELAINDIIDLIFKYKTKNKIPRISFKSKDIVLITYGDQVSKNHETS